MSKKSIRGIAMMLLCIFSLACTLTQYVLLGMTGVQGQVDSLTQVAVPLETDTPTVPVTTTPIPEQEIVQEQTDTPSPTDDPDQELMGTWTGTVDWQCVTFPASTVTINLRADGSCTTALTSQGITESGNGRWTRSGTYINLDTTIEEFNLNWSGTISGSTISGTVFYFLDSSSSCTGVWSAVNN